MAKKLDQMLLSRLNKLQSHIKADLVDSPTMMLGNDYLPMNSANNDEDQSLQNNNSSNKIAGLDDSLMEKYLSAN